MTSWLLWRGLRWRLRKQVINIRSQIYTAQWSGFMVQPSSVMRRSLNHRIHLCGRRDERSYIAQALSFWIMGSDLSRATKMWQPEWHPHYSWSGVPSAHKAHLCAFFLYSWGARTEKDWNLLHQKRKSTGVYIHQGAGCSKIREIAWKIEHFWSPIINLPNLGTFCV